MKNKIAIVTGASKGIGLATVKAFLEEGMKVVGWSRSKPSMTHSNFFPVRVDVSNYDAVTKAINDIVELLGEEIAVLVNNAGLGFESLFEEMDIEKWHEMFNVNVNGLFYCSKVVVPYMKKLGEGHIINIASIAGTTGIEKMAGYCGTKFAVKGISQSMFKELRKFGIKVTCVSPGSVKTNFFDPIASVTVNENMMDPEDIAGTLVHVLKSPSNYHPVDIEVRPFIRK